MLDFRKVLLALSVAGLGLVGTASAQVPVFTLGIPSGEGYVAAEGTTEQIPALTLTQTGGGAPTGAPAFLLTSNVPFANQLLAGSSSKIDVIATDAAGDVATVTQPGPTTIQIAFNAGLSAGQTITVSNIRVNASQAPVSSQITISVAATGVTVAPGAGSSANVGFVSKAISGITVNVAVPGNISTCALATGNFAPVANVIISEGFPEALKAIGDTGTAAAATGNPMAQGTALVVTLSNLDTGVNYYVPAAITVGGLTLTAWTSPTSGVAVPVATTPALAPVGTPAQILVTAASPTINYVVTASGGLTTPAIPFQVNANVPSASGVPAFATAAVGVSAVLAGPAAPAYPGYSGAITYTGTAAATNATNGLILPCATTILFPYVTNNTQYGYDTGIALTNASTLPTGVSGIKASSGSCNLTFYGTGAATASPVAVSYGSVTTGTIGTPVAMSQTAAAGLTGYAVAVCNFLGAHGYAFVSDYNSLNDATSASYLGVILSSGGDVYTPNPAAPPGITPIF